MINKRWIAICGPSSVQTHLKFTWKRDFNLTVNEILMFCVTVDLIKIGLKPNGSKI